MVGDKTEIEKCQILLTGNKICGMNKLINEVQEAIYMPSCSTNKRRSLFNQVLLGPHFVHFNSLFFILIIATIFTFSSVLKCCSVLGACILQNESHTVSIATVCMTAMFPLLKAIFRKMMDLCPLA